jgi:hypothetical protein
MLKGSNTARGWNNSAPSTMAATTTTTINLEVLLQAIELCRTATETSDEAAAGDRKPAEKGKRVSSAGCAGDDADGASSSDEEWVEAADPIEARSDCNRHREMQLLEGIKRSVQQLERQVAAMKKRQESNDTSASSIKDRESEKAVLSGMFPTSDCRHEGKVWYGNGAGHGLRCAVCNFKVFRKNNGDILMKLPKKK